MTDEPAVLCTICARGGSKGVPRKNVRSIGGEPLIAHTIEDAKAWDRDAEILVSTDDEAIASTAREYGAWVPFERPAELATDEAAKLPVVQHAVEYAEDARNLQYDYVVDLDPTAPLRNVEDIEDCFETATEPDVNNVYSVTEADKNPYFNMVELDEDGYASLSKELDDGVDRRQDAPAVYAMNASIYVYDRDCLIETESIHSDRTKVSVMPPERSIDIDREIDLELVKLLFEREHA